MISLLFSLIVPLAVAAAIVGVVLALPARWRPSALRLHGLLSIGSVDLRVRADLGVTPRRRRRGSVWVDKAGFDEGRTHPLDAQTTRLETTSDGGGFLLEGETGVIRVRRTTTVGRSSHSDLRLSDAKISRDHARLRMSPDGVFVEDLSSTNGTEVNGKPLQGATLLRNGDNVSFGGTPACRFTLRHAGRSAKRRRTPVTDASR